MSRLDRLTRIVWLIIGIAVLVWLGAVRAPEAWRRWETRRARTHRPAPTRRDHGVVVGEQARQDRAAGVQRQGLRFGQILDPKRPLMVWSDDPAGLDPDDWLLIAVQLAEFSHPRVSTAMPLNPINPQAQYTWKLEGTIGGYQRVPLRAVNIVFYRRDGGGDRLLLEQPAWIHAVFLPADPSERFYYEIATADTNDDDRLNEDDDATLWSSRADGSDLRLVWMPPGRVESNRFREPLSGDVFGTLVTDSDGDGMVTRYDRSQLFRIALGDTLARSVVSETLVSRLREIVFGETIATSR